MQAAAGAAAERGLAPKLLLVGRPGAGKSTVAQRTADFLRGSGLRVGGFFTGELRERGRRVGFAVETFPGERATLAHVSFPGPPRVSKYGVDVEAFERVALPALAKAADADVVIIDELGKMELASKAFRDAVKGLFDGALPIVATVQSAREPFTDRLKRRADVERTPVLFLPHPVAAGDGRGEIDSMAIAGRALTSGRFV